MKRSCIVELLLFVLMISACAPDQNSGTKINSHPSTTPARIINHISTGTASPTVTLTPPPTKQVIIHPSPGDLADVKGLGQSKTFSVQINGTAAFVYEADQGWSFFNFAFENTEVVVEVTVNNTVDDWKIRPESSKVTAAKDGNKFSIKFSEPQKIVLQLNGRNGQKLLISAEPPERDIPTDNEPGVLYFGPGVHYLGYKFKPPAEIDTIYLAGGAVVRGTLRLENRRNFRIIGRGIFAMGEWPHDEEEGLNLHFNPGLVVDGITIVDSPGWQLSIGGGNNIVINNVKLVATKSHGNTDGIQMWGQDRVSVSNFFILANDDSFPIGPGVTNAEVRNGILWNNENGASFMLGWGGGQDTHDILFENIDVLENGSYGTGVFSARWGEVETSTVSRVTYRNIRVENAVRSDGTHTLLIDMKTALSPWNPGTLGNIERINFERVSFPNGGAVIQGADADNGYSHMRFSNCTIDGQPLTNATQLSLRTKFAEDVSFLYGSQIESMTETPFPTIPAIGRVPSTPLPPGTELLKNPGFEEGISNWSPYNQARLVLDSEVVHSGKWSLKVTRKDRYTGAMQDIWPVVLAEGQGSYTISAYIRLEAGSGSKFEYYPVVSILDSDGAQYLGCGGFEISDQDWAHVSCDKYLSWSGIPGKITFYVENGVAGDGTTYYIDDVSLKKVP